MIRFIIIFSLISLLFSCGNIEFVLDENNEPNKIKNRTIVFFEGIKNDKFNQEIFSFLGKSKSNEFLLITTYDEKKVNKLVKKNQVAEKINYELIINYELYYQTQKCKIHNKRIISRFSFVPKSFGYNFGTDRSLERLYKNSIRENIQIFIGSLPSGKACKNEN